MRRPQWINAARHTPDGWLLEGRGGRGQGTFDAVVIAHNGKCANRLAEPMGLPALHAQLRRLRLSANWVLMAAFEAGGGQQRPMAPSQVAPGGLEGAFVRGCDVLSWAGNNTAKLSLGGAYECWTLVSTQGYGRRNKVPQESVPPEAAARVRGEMLAAFERSLGLPPGGLPPPVFTKAQVGGCHRLCGCV